MDYLVDNLHAIHQLLVLQRSPHHLDHYRHAGIELIIICETDSQLCFDYKPRLCCTYTA